MFTREEWVRIPTRTLKDITLNAVRQYYTRIGYHTHEIERVLAVVLEQVHYTTHCDLAFLAYQWDSAARKLE